MWDTLGLAIIIIRLLYYLPFHRLGIDMDTVKIMVGKLSAV
jgi:hypothetical protein